MPKIIDCLARWGTVAEIVHDLEHQGFAVETHSVRRDMKALLGTYPQRKFNVNSNGYGEENTA
jgi:arginine repressor